MTVETTQHQHTKLNQWFATAICGNDILSSTLYVSGIAIIFAGVLAPVVLAIIGLVLFFYKAVYTEVVEALPVNGGAYNCLLNATSKWVAAVAGSITILSYVATAVLSGQSAVSYLHSGFSLVPIIPVTIGLLLFFAVLVIMGIKDSAKVALGIFAFHVIVLTIFVFIGLFHIFQGHNYFMENLAHTKEMIGNWKGLGEALLFGFAASLLGVSGFESSANFVEEQGQGVFRKTLRNMLIGVAIFNPLIAFICLTALPYHTIVSTKDFVLANVGYSMGGTFFQYVVIIDAFIVLSGAVLTAFVGVGGLIFRMAADGCLPNFLTHQNAKGSYPRIVIAFFLLCTSILVLTGGDLLALAGVYTIAFLSVMTMFAMGNLLLRETRTDLKRTYHAPIVFVIIAMFATMIGVYGNIKIDTRNLDYFLLYFIPTIIIVFSIVFEDTFLKFALRASKNIKPIHRYIERHFNDMTDGRFVAFIHHLDKLHEILDYINRNETGWNVTLVHCNNHAKGDYDKTFEELKTMVDNLKKMGAYKHMTVSLLYMNKPFGPKVIDDVSQNLDIRKNRILIGSIHDFHPFDYAELGGVRIIL